MSVADRGTSDPEAQITVSECSGRRDNNEDDDNNSSNYISSANSSSVLVAVGRWK